MRKHLPDQAAEEIGRAVLTGRRNGVAWKSLERVYNRTERQLRRYAEAVSAKCPVIVGSTAQMSGFECCGAHDRDGDTRPQHDCVIRGPFDDQGSQHCHFPAA